MPAMPISFGLQSNRGRFKVDSSVSIINAYAEKLDIGGKAQVGLYAAPGLRPWVKLPEGPWRGFLVVHGVLFVVSGSKLYRVSTSGAYLPIATIPGSDPVSMAANALAVPDILLVTGGRLYHLKGGAFQEVQNDTILPPVDVSYVRGRFALPASDGRWTYTDINSINVDGTYFYTAEARPDGLVASWDRRQEVWMFGTESLEVFSPTQNDDDPFNNSGGGARPIGCLAGNAIAEIADRLFWIDHERHVRMAQGYDPVVISTPFVTRIIEAEPEKSRIVGHAYTISGASYYEISGSTFTLRFSLATEQWTERRTGGMDRWRGQGAILFNDRTVVGDVESGQLYHLDADFGFDGDEPVVMRLVAPLVHAWPVPLSIFSLHLNIITAVGKNSGDANIDDPTVVLRLSEDGGLSWFSALPERLGRAGESRRVIWRELGTFERDGATVELTLPAPVARCVMEAVINGDTGST